jgi:hypothetical protein
MKTLSRPFQYIEDQTDPFLALFPHRYDYLVAEHPEPGQHPAWRTERRHPLSDRLLHQGAYLYGVRFGKTTQYCLLDIDAGSIYHPSTDSLAVSRLLEALETLDLIQPIICTSSASNGLHLYFPLSQAVSTWTLAIALSTVLSNAGFHLRAGQLELFPNPKPYAQDTPSLYNGHRLPLQAGSYVLNDDFQPIAAGRSRFVSLWHHAQSRNQLAPRTLNRILRQSTRRAYKVSTKAAKFLNDLNAEIELGWTDYGQTNRLLGRIALRTYVFHPVLTGEMPLEGQALVDEIVAIARSLPGYQDWCRHQHEIETRAADWARCVETSRYFPYGGSARSLTSAPETEPAGNRWNQQQRQTTRQNIQTLVQQLWELGQLPAKITERFRVLVRHGIGGGSLYRHKDLWHPEQVSLDAVVGHPETDAHAIDPGDRDLECSIPFTQDIHPASSPDMLNNLATEPHNTNRSMGLPRTASPELNSTSLFPSTGGNPLCAQTYSDRKSDGELSEGGNGFRDPVENLEDAEIPRESAQADGSKGVAPRPMTVDQGLDYIRQVLKQVKHHADQWKQTAQQQFQRDRYRQYHQFDQRRSMQMQQFLQSGDPILMAEAAQWRSPQPGSGALG